MILRMAPKALTRYDELQFTGKADERIIIHCEKCGKSFSLTKQEAVVCEHIAKRIQDVRF